MTRHPSENHFNAKRRFHASVWVDASLHVCAFQNTCVSMHMLQEALCIYSINLHPTVYSLACTVNVCAEISLSVFVWPLSSSYKVIHHSKHQMTSPPTPILQLLPFHPPHILHSNGLALCLHPSSLLLYLHSLLSLCPAFNTALLCKKKKCWVVTAGHYIQHWHGSSLAGSRMLMSLWV